MKKPINILCICLGFIFYFSNIFSQTSAWVKQSPLPSGNDINAIYFTDSITGYISAGYELFKTTDGGENWSELIIDLSSYSIYSIFFTDNNTGYFTGYDKIFKTNDGGNSFNLLISGTSSSFNSVFFASPDTGFALSSDKLFRTTDAGISWQIVYTQTSYSMNSVFFTSSTTGFISGSNTFMKTTNGGQTWTNITNGMPAYPSIYGINFPTSSNGFVLGYNSVYKTTDSGNSWTNITVTGANSLNTIFFTDNNTGYIGGYGGKIYKTTNGGNTWSQQITNTTKDINEIFFINQNIGYSASDAGIILKTENSGNSWQNISSGTNSSIQNLMFLNSDTGYACAYDCILKTTNSGKFWRKIYETTNSLNNLFFTSETKGFAVTSNTILKTTDGGSTWETKTSPVSSLDLIFFASDSYGIITGSSGMIIKTTDGGNNWSSINTGVTSSLSSIFFLNNDTGFIGGASGTILKTTDSGNTWVNHGPGGYYEITDIKFYNTNTGYATSSSVLYKTINGGDSWQTVNSSFSARKISVIDENNFYGLGYSNFYTSTDGGNTIESYNLTETSFYNLFFQNKDTGYISGSGGKIYMTVNGGCQYPLQPGNISGDTVICQKNISENYYVPHIQNASEYIWNYSGTATISNQNANYLTLSFDNNSTSGILTVMGRNHCGDGEISTPFQININVIPDDPVISVLSSDTLISSIPDGNQWYKDYIIIPGANNQKYLPLSNGIYCTRITNLQGCISNFSNYLFFSGIDDFESRFFLSYNNPVNKILFINSEYSQICSVSVISCSGIYVIHNKYNILNNIQMNVGHLAKGLYFLLIQTNSGQIIKKIEIL